MTETRGQGALLSADAVLHRAAERLAQQFDGMVNAETVERVVFESYAALGRTASIKTHLPSLAEKFAHDRLTALAQSKGVVAKRVPEVLHVCVQRCVLHIVTVCFLAVHVPSAQHSEKSF